MNMHNANPTFPNASPILAELSPFGIKHGFFDRHGGVSQGIYASLNCGYGSGDNIDHVRENRRLVADAMGVKADRLLTVHQYHSAEVVDITSDSVWHSPSDAAKADGMVTKCRGVGLGILTADCVPVLFADAKAGVIGAAHAGWRGALGGITDEIIRSMCRLGARTDHIIAAIGPCIGAASYEVSAEFYQQFLQADAQNDRFFTQSPQGKPDHFHFAIADYVKMRLHKMGVTSVSVQGDDTAALPEKYFSWRRTCWQNQTHYGRMISVIALV